MWSSSTTRATTAGEAGAVRSLREAWYGSGLFLHEFSRNAGCAVVAGRANLRI